MPTINVRELIHALDSPVCQCQQPKPRGVVLCDACCHNRYIETKQPGECVNAACERLNQWEDRT
jgi:hypothetical protein